MASKRSQILEYLRTVALPAIKTADGFNFTPKIIERGIRHPGSNPSFPILFITRAPERRKNNVLGTPRTYDSTMSVDIVAYVKNSKTNPQAAATGVQLDIDRIIEDIERAIYADITFGGLATGASVVGIEPDEGDLAPVGAVIVTVEVTYYQEGNPQ